MTVDCDGVADTDDITFDFFLREYVKNKKGKAVVPIPPELGDINAVNCKPPENNSGVTTLLRKRSSKELKIPKKPNMSYRNPHLPPLADGPPVHIGVDSEWVFNPVTGQNEILSYQYCIKFADETLSGIIYTEGPERKYRLSLTKFLSLVIKAALADGILVKWPETIYIYAHFLRADFASFSDCWDIKTKVGGIKGTIGSFRSAYGIDFEDVSGGRVDEFELGITDRKAKKLRHSIIKFVDTMLLTPNGAKLAEIGKLIGLPKLEIPAPYSIGAMDVWLKEDKAAFERYAMRDAEIAVIYGLRFRCFAVHELKLNNSPMTIGGAAVKLFRNSFKPDKGYFNEIFGFEITKRTFHNRKRGKKHTQTKTVVIKSRKDCEANASEAFIGARNEAFYSGPTDIGLLNDYDLAGAYTTALLCIHPLDYANAFYTKNIDDFCGNQCGFARVKFKFPKGTRFPSLPVPTADYGIYYPEQGTSMCTLAEIVVAKNLNCEITIEWGVIVPWLDESVCIFNDFVRLVNFNRALHVKGSLEEKLWKEIGNSIYGKLGQGLHDKTGFDTVPGLSKKLSPSAVTHPYFAAFITGFIRAVISELIASIPSNCKVYSVTTDGFLTDAHQSEICMTGPLTSQFDRAYQLINPGKAMLVRKHVIKQGLPFKTRGCITIQAYEDEPIILAKTGIKPPCPPEEHNAWMLELYKNRQVDQKIESSHLISLREQWTQEADLIDVKRESFLNMEYDFKRRPVHPRMMQVDDIELVAFDTVPWSNREEGELARTLFDGWRVFNCIKTLADYESWVEYYEIHKLIKGSGLKSNNEDSSGILRRIFLRAYSRGAWGASGAMTYLELANWLTVHGYETKIDHIKYGKRAKLIENVVPATSQVIKLLKVLLSEFPDLELAKFFEPSGLITVYAELGIVG